MKTVELSSLPIGSTADCEYYSPRGELLIAKGTFITENHLEILRRRNIFQLQIPSTEDDEIRDLITKEFDNLSDLDIGSEEVGGGPVSVGKPGKEGLDELKRSESVLNLDRQIREHATTDRPVGPALKGQATEMSVQERTDQYKDGLCGSYEDALKTARRILDVLAQGEWASAQEIKSIVANFVKLYVSDRNILLNLSVQKPSDNEYVYSHSLNVCLLSINIAAAYGYSEPQVIEIGIGALLHDVGMLLIPRRIRCKEGRLTDDEWYEIQKHPILGLHLLEKIRSLPPSVPFIAYQVHERANAKGYPKQRHGVLIHRFAKVVQVADIYEAMTAPRPHREAMIPYRAMANLIKMTKQGLVAEDFVKAFLEYASLFPVGSLVQLNDNRIGKVIASNGASYARPVLSILTDSRGTLLDKRKIYQVDLKKDRDCQISRALPSDQLADLHFMHGF